MGRLNKDGPGGAPFLFETRQNSFRLSVQKLGGELESFGQ